MVDHRPVIHLRALVVLKGKMSILILAADSVIFLVIFLAADFLKLILAVVGAKLGAAILR